MFRNRSLGPTRHISSAIVVGAVAMLALGACSSDDGTGDAGGSTSTAVAATPRPTDASDGTAVSDPWAADAQEHRGENGKTFDYECPADGDADTIWGVETYTDDSSVCTAAVQVGLITIVEGGDVTIEIVAGQDSYEAGTANGITSTSYGSWGGSFVFPDAPPGSGDFEISAATWDESARTLEEGETKTLTCAPNGEPGGVWGSGPFTADSSICGAGALVGVITLEDGGDVTITVTAGQDSYTGSTANGVTSTDYGSYDLSFTVEGA